jgi:hypothetical protein
MKFPVLWLLVCCGCLHAQSIDESRSRFLSSPNGRTGTFAPYRVVVGDLDGVDTLIVRSISDGVILRREVAVAGRQTVTVVLPVMVGESARVEIEAASVAEIKPDLPQRRIEPDYARPYVAVFSTDPVYARGVLASTPGGAVCDYFELDEFFTDWRLLDGYDAVVILNPAEVRLPEGSQRAIAEFCSLGGATLVAGSFRLGEKAVDLPAPTDAVIQVHRGVTVQRFGYGPGAIYRISADDLRRSLSAQDVIVDALRDHFWFGAQQPPGGKPDSRVAPARSPLAPSLPPASALPGPLFWGLAGGLVLICGLLPAVIARSTRRVWPTQVSLVMFCASIGIFGHMQDRPLPAVEVSAVIQAGEGEAASARTFVHVHGVWRNVIEIDLDDGDNRVLYRAMPAAPGWNAWVGDSPLVEPTPGRAAGVELKNGMVGGRTFRDFGTEAHRGNTQFSREEAYLVDWWLEANAYRGRAAEIAPVEPPFEPDSWDAARLVPRGAIRLTSTRAGD